MAIDKNINTLEKDKFFETTDLKTAVRVGFSEDTTFSGEFTPGGLKIAGRVTIVSIDDTNWTALPATALANRNAISVINRSGVQIKLNYSASVSGYIGVPVDNGSERFYDISDQIVVYGKSSSGSAELIIEELA
jgi:hypothetical protein